MAPGPQQPYQLHLTDRYPGQSDETLARLKSSPASQSDFTITPGSRSEFTLNTASVAEFPLVKHDHLVSPKDPELASKQKGPAAQQGSRKGKAFWMILFALVISFFMVVLEGAAVGNASPTIASDLDIEQFAWIGTAYGLSSTALLPLSGGLAQVREYPRPLSSIHLPTIAPDIRPSPRHAGFPRHLCRRWRPLWCSKRLCDALCWAYRTRPRRRRCAHLEFDHLVRYCRAA